MKNALVTLAIGEREFLNHTGPLMKRYAGRIGADFRCISSYPAKRHYTNGRENNQAYITKCDMLYDLLSTYERIFYVDDTVCIHPDTPDLFSMVPPHTVGAFNEGSLGKYSANSDHDYILANRNYQISTEKYINAGLMVVSRPHQFLFDYRNMDQHRELFCSFFVEQTYLNYMIQSNDVAMTCLPESFNRMRVSKCETQYPEIEPEFIWNSGNHIYHVTSWYDEPERRLGYVKRVCDILAGERSRIS